MKSRNLQNKRLNDIEKKILGAAQIPEGEIEKVVGNPQLFGSVMARIKVEKSNLKREDRYANRQFFSIRNWRTIGLSFAVLLIISLAAGNFILRRIKGSSVDLAVDKTSVNDFPNSISVTDVPKLQTDDSSPTVQPINFKTKTRTSVSQKIIKREIGKSQTPPKLKTQSSPKSVIPDEKVFYSLAFPGAAEVGNGERQIVRTELSRPDLFALGVNVAAGGDDNRKYKTDLIIGADGIPQAIRLVE